jgi:hypothetical protein
MKVLWIVLAALLVTGCVVVPAPYTADVYGPSVSVGIGGPVYYSYPYYHHRYYYTHHYPYRPYRGWN